MEEHDPSTGAAGILGGPSPNAARFLRLRAALWAVVGVAFLVAPGWLAEYMNMFLPTTTGRIHVRATHGGLPLGIGLFLWSAARRAAWRRPALGASMAIDLGLLAGTLAGIVIAGGTIPRIVALAGAELLLGLIAVRLLAVPPANVR